MKAGEDPVNISIIDQKWSSIIEVLKEQFPRVYNGIKNAKYDLHGTTIVLHLKSEPLRKSIEERLKLLNQHTQKTLNNRHVNFAFEIKAVAEEEKTLYLTKDKISHYIEKNKAIKTLVDTFNLDL